MVSPTRKIMRVMSSRRNICKKREKQPLTLSDCLDRPPERSLRGYLLLILIIPCLYYVYWLFKPASVVQYYTIVDKEYLKSLSKRVPGFIDDAKQKYFLKVAKYRNKLHLNNDAGTTESNSISNEKPMCVMTRMTLLGTISVNKSVVSLPMSDIEKAHPMVNKGGHYNPLNCRPRHRVAILVPYRNREANLKIFLFNIHPFLMRQYLEYRIFIIEQLGNETYNKGRLFNAGFKEAKKLGSWQCYVFHDVDLLPLDDRILYSCPTFPRHMSATIVEKLHYKGIYRVLFGGVTSMSPQHYEKANGYSNMYWGWGGEDHDMFWRLRSSGLPVNRYNRSIARYTSMPHPMEKKNPFRYQLLHTAIGRRKEEGLATVEYEVIFIDERSLFTHMMIAVNPYNENITVMQQFYSNPWFRLKRKKLECFAFKFAQKSASNGTLSNSNTGC